MAFEDQHGLSGSAVRTIDPTNKWPAASYDMTSAGDNVVTRPSVSEADQIAMADGHGIAAGVAPVLRPHFEARA